MGDPRVLGSPWVSILKWSNYNIISDDLGVPSESMGDWLSCCSFAKWGFIGCSCLPVHWSSILPKPVARLEVSIVWREERDSQSQKSWSHKYTASSRLHPMIQNYNTRQFKFNLWSLDSSWWLVVSHIHPYSSHLVDPESWMTGFFGERRDRSHLAHWIIDDSPFIGWTFWRVSSVSFSFIPSNPRQIDRAVRYGQKFGSPVAPKSVGSFYSRFLCFR